jgi:hypothetical protein
MSVMRTGNSTANGSIAGSSIRIRAIPACLADFRRPVKASKLLLITLMNSFRANASVGRRKSAANKNVRTQRHAENQIVLQDGPADLLGDLRIFPIVGLVQTLVDQRRTGSLTLTGHDQWIGKIGFIDGAIVHAATATGAQDRDAFFELLTVTAGQFLFRPGIRPQSITITDPPDTLLLEAHEWLDTRGNPPAAA